MDDDLREAVEKAMSAVEAHFEADPMPTIAAREIDKLKAREAALADKVLDGVFSDDDPSSEENRASPPFETNENDQNDEASASSQPVVPLPDPPKSVLKSKLRRAQSAGISHSQCLCVCVTLCMCVLLSFFSVCARVCMLCVCLCAPVCVCIVSE